MLVLLIVSYVAACFYHDILLFLAAKQQSKIVPSSSSSSRTVFARLGALAGPETQVLNKLMQKKSAKMISTRKRDGK